MTEALIFRSRTNRTLRGGSGQASGARVVGLSTTNAADKIAPYCHLVVPDYLDAALWPFVVGDKN
jgi:hypothetical protein